MSFPPRTWSLLIFLFSSLAFLNRMSVFCVRVLYGSNTLFGSNVKVACIFELWAKGFSNFIHSVVDNIVEYLQGGKNNNQSCGFQCQFGYLQLYIILLCQQYPWFIPWLLNTTA